MIRNWIADHGEGPSVRQIGERVGLSSSSGRTGSVTVNSSEPSTGTTSHWRGPGTADARFGLRTST
ncbi:hypothetical protein ABZY45_19575 [Streptomyces sp. NPDC006516]|uniref:hypothetical protein n=1 Tax=Streptomyces sp. NPDC006516 TaxID=3154309 RepID=UPI0033A27912